MPPHTSPEVRNMVVSLHNTGSSERAIAKNIGRPRSTVHHILDRHHRNPAAANISDPNHNRGSRSVLSDRDHRHLCLQAMKHRSYPARELLDEAGLTGKITPNGANRILREKGLDCRHPRKKPSRLKPEHRQRRLAWAEARSTWTIEQWQKVIFTDESSFELAILVQEYNEGCLAPSFKSGRSSSNSWGAISYFGRSELVALSGEGRMTGIEYAELILKNALKVYYDEVAEHLTAGTHPEVVEDNAPCHTAKAAKKAREDLEMTVSDWPARSPDLNPIETLWRVVKRQIAKRPKAENVGGLEIQISEEWEAVGLEIIQGLIESMPNRVAAVIAAKGGPTKY